ncbi:ATP-binding protein [Dichotomicrobium thermohalophilum]|uniref:histidine kinase n=1 Tax=Dichotomicrobium thermohalophilum TaxID=933063 RepID=A0A397Q584_9HYPH|nr:ATP-binding protein [Dichotomicrobium thermohalophilum]RIA54965.1 signal transduction histidine kinase [Dichotomicrobium thermohalophilum]
MTRNSLAFRLSAAAAACILLILPATGVVLVSVYRGAIEDSFDGRLNTYVKYLIGSTFRAEEGLRLEAPETLGEPLFSLPASGWYWQIAPANGEGEPLLKSASLVSESLALPTAGNDDGELQNAYITGPDGELLRVVARDIIFPGPGETRTYTFAVAGNAGEIDESVWSFTTMLIAAFAALGAALLVATFIQVRYGLRPLGDIRARLAAIRSGDAERLEGELPAEIQPLQKELNSLIRANQQIIERARTHVGNLAHALKTPLSVITNEARDRDDPFSRKVSEQAEIMRQQVTHHLDRARVAARAGVVGRATAIQPVIETMRGALAKIYSDSQLDLTTDCPGNLHFEGEKQDLQEMIGNLMDNACKWANGRVAVSAAAQDGGGHFLRICVDDDGPGLSPKAREKAMKRGRRLDENKPGSGLGLSIVADLANLYSGDFRLEESPLGGLRAVLILPSVQSP